MSKTQNNGPFIGRSLFEEEGTESAIELFVRQVKESCEKSGSPLPNVVKNYRHGDTVLYKGEKTK